MPDCMGGEVTDEGGDDVVTFALEILEPTPQGVKLSKKNICFVDIEPDNNQADEKAAHER